MLLARDPCGDLTDGLDVAEDVIERNWIVALGMAGFVIWQNDEAVNAGRCKCLNRGPVERTYGRNRDFESSEFRRSSMPLGGAAQILQVLFGVLQRETETVPAVAHGNGAAERRWTFTADHKRWHGALKRKRV